MFDPAAGDRPDEDLASAAVWFDAFVTNIDRTARNPNLLCWHKSIYFIDHGAAIYFHHDWKDTATKARSPFPAIREHVLLPWAARIPQADRNLRTVLSREVLEQVLDQVPDGWLLPEPGLSAPSAKRTAYVDYFCGRLDASSEFVEEAVRARATLV
jgi:hypothetical protein